MKKNVLIKVKGSSEQEEFVEFITHGELVKDNDIYTITYKETEITGMEGTTTTVKLEGKKVTLSRTGANNTVMVFEQGARHVSCYETMFGALTIGILSRDVKVKVDDCGGDVYANYMVNINNTGYVNNGFSINFKENG